MKSKTSFINKAVFKKNVTLYWPIWVCYLFYILAKVPGVLWFELSSQKTLDDSVTYWGLYYSLNLKTDLLVIAVVAVISGMALFSYLYTPKSAYMIHSLPVTRTELFFTNVLSGLAFMIVPQILAFLVTVIICLANGIAIVQYVAMWLLCVMGIAFFLYSLVCFCATITGLLFVLPLVFLVMNYLAVGLAVGVRLVLSCLGYGIKYNYAPDIRFLKILSPIYYMYDNVGIKSVTVYNAKGELDITGLDFQGGKIVLGYVLAAIVVYLVAYYCFRIRKSERAGDLLAFGWLKPVFRWGVGVCVGYVCGIVAREFLSMVEITVSLPVLFLLIVVFGIIAFYVADMFVQKSFRVFNRRRFRECCLFLGFSLLGFGVINGVSRAIEYYIPSESQISAAYLYMNYPVEFRGEDITKVVDVQKEILDKSAVFEKETQSTGEAGYIYLIYVLDNGNRIERNYTIPYKDEWCSTLVDTLYSYETEPENFMHYMVGYDYEQIASFTDVELEYDTQGDNYVRHNIDTVSARRIYDAVCRDAQEGTLQKYNVSNYMKQDSEEDYEIAYLYFSYLHKDSDWEDVFSRTGQNNMTYYDSYMDANERRYGYMNLSFGADCTNIIEALCQEGVISSEEDLLFRSAE